MINFLKVAKMNSTVPDTPSLLIAMVSRDVIVLAKLIRTLCPRRVLLFCTPHAMSAGWAEAAQRLLVVLTERRPDIVSDFSLVGLPDDNLPARLNTYGEEITAACARIGDEDGRVYFDCTTGQSIFHVIGVDALRAIAAKRGIEVGTVYCDADTGTILRSSHQCGYFTHDVQNLDFRFTTGQELAERFEIYGVTTNGGTQLWPVSKPAEDAAALIQLYDALIEQDSLRAIFHSYQSKMKRWKQRQQIGRDIPLDAIWHLSNTRIWEIAAQACRLARAGHMESHIRKKIGDVLIAFAGERATTQTWLNRYLQDKRLSALQASLRHRITTLPTSLAPGKTQGPLRQSLLKELNNSINGLVQTLRHELEGYALATGHEPGLFTKEDWRNWLVSELQDIPLAIPVRDLLLSPDRQLPFLFEECIGQAAARFAASDGLGDQVASIYQNLVLFLEEKPIAELDTLVLLRDGGIAVVEVKTHRANADNKKIESNIKQIRDFGGAFSAYTLVYPLKAADLEGIRQGR